jgi:hypothetical protein
MTRHPTRPEVREAAGILRERTPDDERIAEVQWYIAFLRNAEPMAMATRTTIAEFLEKNHLTKARRGAPPSTRWHRGMLTVCWRTIEERCIFWRDAFTHRCARRYPRREAIRRVAKEIGFTEAALEKGMRRFHKARERAVPPSWEAERQKTPEQLDADTEARFKALWAISDVEPDPQTAAVPDRGTSSDNK